MVQRVDPLRWNSPVTTTEGFPSPFFTRQWNLLVDQLASSSVAVLMATGVTPGTYGSADSSVQLTVGADGRITAATSLTISQEGLTHQQVLARVSVGM